jgi:riboflavin kinase/FMN adenylyltransferase
MLILNGVDNVPARAKGSALAIGNFDGVHRGHQAVLGEAIIEARRLGSAAGAMIFEPLAREYFQPDKPFFRLMPLPRKLALFEALGLDLAVVMGFDRPLAEYSARGFVEQVLVGRLGVRHVVIGYHFFFGKGREGSPDTMRALGKELGFGVSVVAPAGTHGEVFSSTRVRELLAEGHVRDAAEMLGHWWRIKGTVVSGHKIGTGLGYPTANIHLPVGVQLHHGIYAVRVYDGPRQHRGAAYLGTRPTFDNGRLVLEVFLFDFDGDLYGHEIEIEFIAFVRQDAKFRSADALKAQMDKDCANALAALEAVAAKDPLSAFPLARGAP